MSFKEMLEEDLEKVFFSTDELADIHRIDGKEVPCVLDMGELKGDSATFTVHSRNMQYTSDTLQFGDRVLFIRKAFFERMPKVEQKLRIDDKLYSVLDVNEQRGLLQIHLRDIDY